MISNASCAHGLAILFVGVGAVQQLSLGRNAQIIGVMTAMGESSLVNITYGDDINGVVNPNGTPTSSIGLFQHQDWWGSVEDRMNPTKAATMFFDRLNAVKGWQDMEPSHAIWRVQINSDKNHYAKYDEGATAIVDTLNGPCAGSGEWIVPARGTVSGTFGDSRGDHAHMGTDPADGTCGGPIWAASAGVVDNTGSNKGGGGYIWITHADGVMTGYFHMKVVDFLVTEGQTVEAGDQIGKVGNEGNSYGCDLHYEVKVDGEYVNPQTFMEGVGVPLPL